MGGHLLDLGSGLGVGGKWPIPANTPPSVTPQLEAVDFELVGSCKESTHGSSTTAS